MTGAEDPAALWGQVIFKTGGYLLIFTVVDLEIQSAITECRQNIWRDIEFKTTETLVSQTEVFASRDDMQPPQSCICPHNVITKYFLDDVSQVLWHRKAFSATLCWQQILSDQSGSSATRVHCSSCLRNAWLFMTCEVRRSHLCIKSTRYNLLI